MYYSKIKVLNKPTWNKLFMLVYDVAQWRNSQYKDEDREAANLTT